MGNRAFFYITDQERFVSEANVSGNSIAAVMPDVDIFMFTTLKMSEYRPILYPYSAYVPLPKLEGNDWFLKQTGYMPTVLEWLHGRGYDKVCYMDCDTYVCAPVYELFDMLDTFDIMGVHAPGRETTGSYYKLPRSFPELNIGVNPMHCNAAMQVFWHSVFNLYLSNTDLYSNNDQGPLRDTLWHFGSNYLYYVLPPEYNLRFNLPCFVNGRVKILHGHGASREIADQINANEGMRVWYQNRLFTQ